MSFNNFLTNLLPILIAIKYGLLIVVFVLSIKVKNAAILLNF